MLSYVLFYDTAFRNRCALLFVSTLQVLLCHLFTERTLISDTLLLISPSHYSTILSSTFLFELFLSLSFCSLQLLPFPYWSNKSLHTLPVSHSQLTMPSSSLSFSLHYSTPFIYNYLLDTYLFHPIFLRVPSFIVLFFLFSF